MRPGYFVTVLEPRKAEEVTASAERCPCCHEPTGTYGCACPPSEVLSNPTGRTTSTLTTGLTR
jgi:hypothetical protein